MKAVSHLDSSKMLPSLVSLVVAGQQLQHGQCSLIVLHDKCQVSQLAHLTLCSGGAVLGHPPRGWCPRPRGLRSCAALASKQESFELVAEAPPAHCHLHNSKSVPSISRHNGKTVCSSSRHLSEVQRTTANWSLIGVDMLSELQHTTAIVSHDVVDI